MFGLRLFPVIPLILLLGVSIGGQSFINDIARQSARSDIRTGGLITKADLEPYNRDVRLTINIPSFEMTLWQGGNEIKRYYVGVGLKEYPIFLGLRQVDTIIWNPSWIPPRSGWVAPALQGKVIGPSDPRNPLGKIKIPLGYGYLIHQAKSQNDLGNLVSHGCVRVMRNDLYDLNDKILSAHGLELGAEVRRAKRSKRTFVIELDGSVDLEITYDTTVVENDILRIYPDIYGYRREKVDVLRAELDAVGIDQTQISNETLEAMISMAKGKAQYVIDLNRIRSGDYMNGEVMPVVGGRQP